MNENRDDRIRESINNIEPAAGARERMLENIQRKAAEQTSKTAQEIPQKTKVLSISKFLKWALPVAACFAIAIIGVNIIPNITNSPSIDNQEVEIANPFVPVSDSSAFAKQLGINIDAPDGATSVAYTIVDNEMANIDFDYTGHSYTLRASEQSGDFSGLNGIAASIEQIDSETDAVLTSIKSSDEIYRKIEWTDGKVRYVLINTDGADPGQMKELYQRVK